MNGKYKTIMAGFAALLVMTGAAWGVVSPPVLGTPGTENVGAGMATLLLQSDSDGTGYFTLLSGSGAACGSGDQVKAGKTGADTPAPYRGSLVLAAATTGKYTIRNLTQSSPYTVCFTAESSADGLQSTPVTLDLTTPAMATYADPAWGVVGNAGFSGGEAWFTSLALAPDGTPYVSYTDYGNNYRATVMKYDGTNWNAVGSTGFSAGQAENTSLAFSMDGTPYVAFKDEANGYKATVMKYNGSDWIFVGSAGFSAGGAFNTSLAIGTDGNPYVAYMDVANSYKATVMKFDGTIWDSVGSAGFSADQADSTSLTVAPDGTPHVVYSDNANSSKATVKKFDGTNWVSIGNAGFSADQAWYTSLAFAHEGTPYVAYTDIANSYKATVMKFDGTSWVTVGSAGFSVDQTRSTSLAFAPDGTLYAAYRDDGYSSKAILMKFNGSEWVIVGSSGFSAGVANYISLAFASDGTPYVAYQDGANGNKATVMSFRDTATITAGVGPNGAISPAGATTLTGGSSQTYTITPDPGYVVTVLSVDGTVLPGATSYTFSNVTSDHYINAYFSPAGFTITAGAGPNGAISPAGVTTLTGVSSQTYTITPDPGYAVTVLSVDGTVLPGATSYTFSNVTGNHYINAYFSPADFTITAGAGPNGAISPAGVTTLAAGASQTYTITPDPGYAVTALSVDGTVLPGAISYTFSNVTGNHYINAYFIQVVTITAGAGPNGAISPVGATTLTGGSSQTYTINPDPGYAVTALSVDGTVLPGATSYTFSNVTGDHYINAYFSPTITINTFPGGLAVNVDGITYTTPHTFAWVPGSLHTIARTATEAGAAGTRYVFANWSDGGALSHQITVPVSTATYTANFTTQYQLTTAVSPAGSGEVSPATGSWYPAGTVVLVRAFPHVGYSFVSWSGPVADSNSAATTVTMDGPLTIAANHAGSPVLSAVIAGKSGGASLRTWSFTVSNSGQSIAHAAQISGLTLNQTSGAACTPVITTPLPVALGDIATGGSAGGAVEIDFTGCVPTARFTAVIGYSANSGTVTGSSTYSNQFR